MNKKLVIIICLIFVCILLTSCTPGTRSFINRWNYAVQKADDETRYSTKKEVEDTCRSMIASYTSDKLTYESYKDSDNEEKQSWAEQAKIRANKTAASYNEYIRKNSFVFDNNIPNDIDENLEYIE